MGVRGHLIQDADGLHASFGLEFSQSNDDREMHLATLERIFAAERVNVVCFEDEAIGRKWAHVYAQDDLEHHAADVFVGTIGRDDRHVTLLEVIRALARWSGRDADAFDVGWWRGDPQEVKEKPDGTS